MMAFSNGGRGDNFNKRYWDKWIPNGKDKIRHNPPIKHLDNFKYIKNLNLNYKTT